MNQRVYDFEKRWTAAGRQARELKIKLRDAESENEYLEILTEFFFQRPHLQDTKADGPPVRSTLRDIQVLLIEFANGECQTHEKTVHTGRKALALMDSLNLKLDADTEAS